MEKESDSVTNHKISEGFFESSNDNKENTMNDQAESAHKESPEDVGPEAKEIRRDNAKTKAKRDGTNPVKEEQKKTKAEKSNVTSRDLHEVEAKAKTKDSDTEESLKQMETSSKESFDIYNKTKLKLYDLHNMPKRVINLGKESAQHIGVKKQEPDVWLKASSDREDWTGINDDQDDVESDSQEFTDTEENGKDTKDSSETVTQPTLLQLAGLAKTADDSKLPRDDGDSPPPPPPPLPETPLTCGGILTKSPITRPKVSTQSSTDEQSPGPSNRSLQGSGAVRDVDLTVARERLRIMIDNLRRFIPLASTHPNPDEMQMDELQTAILDFRYLEQAFLDPEDYLDLDFDDYGGFDFDLPTFLEKKSEPSFARGIEVKMECDICFDDVKLHKRICCDFPACDSCMEQYIETNVNQGIVKVPCLGSSCDAFLYRDEILGRLSVPMKDKFYKFLVDANKDPRVKTCPRCSNIHRISDEDAEQKSKYGLLVVCPECRLEWCFECQAPWHKNIKCREFRKGDKLVKSWAKEKHYGTTNAQKCPKCKIFIERKGGCDHMVCSKCDTGFCYKCGGRYIDMKFFGNHLSRYSPLGCKYNYKPDKPFLRKLIRGSVFGAKLLGGVVLVGLGVAAVGVLLGASVVILPAFGAYKYRRHRKMIKRIKRQQELVKMRSKNAMMELHRERPYMLDPRTLREREALWETLVRGSSERWTRHGGNDTVHIGIQTGQSQQVDVTVHNPYQPDALVANDDTQNSEIRMNITDERGHVTVTTAEFTHNSNAGDGSEAEIVLHVKTSYPKTEKETKNHTSEKVEATNNTEAKVEQPDVTKSDLDKKVEKKVDGNEPNSVSKVNSPQILENRPKSAQVHRRAHSTGSVRKNLKKQDFGSISRKWCLRSLSGRKTSETDSPELPTRNNQDQSESLDILEKNKPSIDSDENSETDNLTQSGCFLKLLGKKLNTYQNLTEKEKQGSTKLDTSLGDRSNCPDVVSCALEAEMKSKENLENVGQSTGVKDMEKDAYMGIVSMETDTTAL